MSDHIGTFLHSLWRGCFFQLGVLWGELVPEHDSLHFERRSRSALAPR